MASEYSLFDLLGLCAIRHDVSEVLRPTRLPVRTFTLLAPRMSIAVFNIYCGGDVEIVEVD